MPTRLHSASVPEPLLAVETPWEDAALSEEGAPTLLDATSTDETCGVPALLLAMLPAVLPAVLLVVLLVPAVVLALLPAVLLACADEDDTTPEDGGTKDEALSALEPPPDEDVVEEPPPGEVVHAARQSGRTREVSRRMGAGSKRAGGGL